jgi:hypothetical protein
MKFEPFALVAPLPALLPKKFDWYASVAWLPASCPKKFDDSAFASLPAEAQRNLNY